MTMNVANEVSFLNRLAVTNVAGQAALFLYKRLATSNKRKIQKSSEKTAASSSSTTTSNQNGHNRRSSRGRTPESVSLAAKRIGLDTIKVWVTMGLLCRASRLLGWFLKSLSAKSAEAKVQSTTSRVGVQLLRAVLQFAFGAGSWLALQHLDKKGPKLRLSLVGGLFLSEAMEAGFQSVFKSIPKAGNVAVKLIMTLAGALLTHSFVLAPYTMPSSDLRLFRIASGLSNVEVMHPRVVAAAGGTFHPALDMEHGQTQPQSATARATTDGIVIPVVDKRAQTEGETPIDSSVDQTNTYPPLSSSFEVESKASSKCREGKPGSRTCCDTYCGLVHPTEENCFKALVPITARALQVALMVYTPFLGVQLVRTVATGKLTAARMTGVATSYARMVFFLTTFSGLVQWLPCLFCQLVPGVKHNNARWIYAASGVGSAGISSLWDSSPKMRSVALVLLPRALQSTIPDRATQNAFMRNLTATAVGFLCSLRATQSAFFPKSGLASYMVRQVQGVA